MRLAFFYCKGEDANRNTFVAVAKGLLSQLLKDNQDLLLQLYDKGTMKSGQATLSDPTMAKDLLEVAFDSPTVTYIIIDGIDECEREERRQICSWFREQVNRVRKEDFGNLRCLFVSREDGPAKKDLGMVPAIKLAPERTAQDIKRYISSWVARIERKHGVLDPQQYPLASIIMMATQGNPVDPIIQYSISSAPRWLTLMLR